MSLLRLPELLNSELELDIMVSSLIDVERRICDELDAQVFICLPGDKSDFFKQRAPLFGEDVDKKFPSVVYEIEEAGKCYAMGRSTASAFHSIRSLEAGIRAISRCLGIQDPTRAVDRNWGEMLKKIKIEIDRRWPYSSNRMAGDGLFFDGAYGTLAAIQNPYRNTTMHLDQKYTSEEALHIMEIVKGFMKKLASRMDENGEPLAP